MAVRNLHFYNRAESIPYPLDDGASSVDDEGVRLPSNIIADINLRWPSTFGRYAFVSAVAVTPGAVTVTILAATTAEGSGDFSPLAVISVRQPVEPHRTYTLVSQVEGVGGWIVFGSGVSDRSIVARFSGPAQSRLTPRAARAYRPLPVSSLRALNAAGLLTGVVTLRTVSPLEAVAESRLIDGVMRDCIVLRLSTSVDSEGTTTPDAVNRILGLQADSVYRMFAGPCAGRPESGTCGDPQPIEFINAVAPDCDGILTIEFTGCAEVTQITDGCGIAVDCGFGLSQACFAAQLPSSEGLLPTEEEPTNIPIPPPPDPEPEIIGDSETYVPLPELPYINCFQLPEDTLDFTVQTGMWSWGAENSPTIVCPGDNEAYAVSQSISESFSMSVSSIIRGGSYVTATAATPNVSLWASPDDLTVFRRVSTELSMSFGPAGARHNGCLVLNHRPHSTNPEQSVYHLVEIDYDRQTLVVSRFNGTAFVVITSVIARGLKLDYWYRLTATIVDGPVGGQTTITARVESIDVPGEIDVTTSVNVKTYQPSVGSFGLGSNRALTSFAFFKVEEAP